MQWMCLHVANTMKRTGSALCALPVSFSVIFFLARVRDRPADHRVNRAGLYASVWADEVLQESELSVWVQAVRDCIPEA